MASEGTLGRIAFFSLAVIFFVSSLVLVVGVPDMVNSPDERAAQFFTRTVAEDHALSFREPLNTLVGGMIAPRSMVAHGQDVLPVGFIGLPLLYGILAIVISVPLAAYLTPLLAVLAAFAWVATLSAVFSRRIATFAGTLLLLIPGYWFYAARSFMHNVPFLAFFIFSLFFLVRRPFGPSRVALHVFLAGASMGIALILRTSEVVWMTAVGAIFLAAFPRALRSRQIALFLLSTLLFTLPFFFWNQYAFGSPFHTGYVLPPSSATANVSLVPSAVELVSSPSALLPFGAHVGAAFRRLWQYEGELVWWMTLLTLLGLPSMFARHLHHPLETRVLRTTMLAALVAGLYLVVLYGSWQIADNPDPSAITLANSYVRYWLPLSLVSTIPAALALDTLVSRARTRVGRVLLALAILIPIGALSARLVFFHPEDGLLHTRAVLLRDAEVRDAVILSTEYDSVIVVDRADKILFPRRRVITPLRSEATFAALPILRKKGVPLYYFGLTLPDEDLIFLNRERLAPIKLGVERWRTFDAETLYRFRSL